MASPTNNNDQSKNVSLYSSDSLAVDRNSVKRDGHVSSAACHEALRAFGARLGYTSPAQRGELLRLMAVALSYGTSAETNFNDRWLDEESEETSLGVFVDILFDMKEFRGKANIVRMWARSYTLPETSDLSAPRNFADLTMMVIRSNSWLQEERSKSYDVDVSVGHVCFDYADAITKKLLPTESMIVNYGLRKKAREGRSPVYSLGNSTTPGTAPADRGVGENVLADSSRVARGTRNASLF